MKNLKSAVKISNIRPWIYFARGNIARLFIIFVGAYTAYLIAVHWPDLFHPAVQAFLFQAGIILTAGWWFFTWLGSRTNTLTFTPDYLIFRGITTTWLNARAPYGFSLREFGYRGKGLAQKRRYIDESFLIVCTHASGDLELGCVYGRNQAETVLNALRVQKGRLNKNRAFSIDDLDDDRGPFEERPRF